MENDAIRFALGEILQRNAEGLVCAYLFGSVARGEEKVDSDIDLAVLYTRRHRPRLRAWDLISPTRWQQG